MGEQRRAFEFNEYDRVFKSINRILPTIEGQITGIFSNSIFLSILELGDVTLVGILFTIISLLFIISDGQIRKFLRNTSENYRNRNWLIVVNYIMDDFYRSFIFMLIQYVDLFIRNKFFGDAQSFLEEIVSFFVVLSILTLVLTIVENFQDNENTENAATVFMRVWNGIYGITIQFFSLFIFQQIKALPNQSQVGIVMITSLVFYLVFEWAIRKFTKHLESSDYYNRNILWYKWINKFLDLLVVFAFFFVIRYIGDFIGNMSDRNRLSILGRFIVLLIVYLITYTIFGLMIYFSDAGLTNSIFVGTFSRIWYKISGSTTGLFALILLEDVFVGAQKNQLLLVLISVLVFYSTIEYFIRRLVMMSESVKDNPQWSSIVTQLMDFPLALTPILIFSVVANYLNSTLNGNQDLIFTHILIVIILQIIATTVFSILKTNGFNQK